MSYDPAPGMRVACVCGTWFDEDGSLARSICPRRGQTLTIRQVEHFPEPFAGIYLRFTEIVNQPDPSDGIEPAFFFLGFKPLDERRLDVFRQHLAPLPIEQVPA